MEVALLLGLGFAGYYLNKNDQMVVEKEKTKIPNNEIPNGPDIYDQNRLKVVTDKERKLAESNYERAQYPDRTNVIPNFYNRLEPLIDNTKFNTQIKFETLNQIYDENEDLDKIYDTSLADFNYNGDANWVFAKQTFDTEIPLPDKDLRNNPKLGEGFVPDLEGINFNPYKNFPNSDNLLQKGEEVSDNASSFKEIMLNDKVSYNARGRKLEQPREDNAGYARFNEINQMDLMVEDKRIYHNPKVREEKDVVTGIISSRKGVQPEYLRQFDDLRFDNQGEAVPQNTVHNSIDKETLTATERSIALGEGWSRYHDSPDQTYGVIGPDDPRFVHSNMKPYFSGKYGYGNYNEGFDDVKQHKMELFNGAEKIYKKKVEAPQRFAPVADMTYIYGTPVRPEDEDSRYIPSLYRQGELLDDPVRVTPGVNLDYNDVGTQGYHSMYRALPKTVDELRVTSKPKVSYEGRVIHGLKGSTRPIQAPVVKYRPDGFKITNDFDLVPTKDTETFAPKLPENFIMPETAR